ncbi:MAG: hypothetical protein J6S21_00900, partial [Victivallales bacterium]|nr:hypothetical protein [Victivallales bacterium]
GVYIFGNVVIGENCEIGPNCCIRGNTAIGDRCRIGQGAEVTNSIIMDDVKISHVSYVGDSIVASGVDIGAGTMTASYRHDGGTVKSMVAGELVDTGRKYFGAVFAEKSRTSINTAILPGRKIAAGRFTMPGDIIRRDL